MRRIVALYCFFAVISPLCAAAPGADDEAGRHTEKAGKFSIVPPATWTVRDIPGLKYKVVVGPARSGFAANINVVDEPFKGPVEDYVKATRPVLEKQLKKFRVEEQGEFKTTSRLRGVRLITENEQGGRLLRQTFYIFGPGETKYVVTCSTLAESGAELDRLFEHAVKTFRIED